MKSNDFWIGENVRIISRGERGKVSAIEKNGLIKVRLTDSGTEVEAFPEDLEIVAEKPKSKKINFSEKAYRIDEAAGFNPEIDLHMENLKDYNPLTWKADELSFQKNTCSKFLKKALRLRVPRVLIIHGKGDGVLKSCVEDLLDKINEVEHTNISNNGGATEVWFKYK